MAFVVKRVQNLIGLISDRLSIQFIGSVSDRFSNRQDRYQNSSINVFDTSQDVAEADTDIAESKLGSVIYIDTAESDIL